MNPKAYLVYVAGKTAGESYLLSDVSREEFMGVACIKGTYRHPSSSAHWMAGRTIYVPLEKVLMVTEYDSHDAYKEALKTHYEAQAERA
jgi:hypothetical protein